MIISENITLDLTAPVKSSQIENALLQRGIKPLRWAIIDITVSKITVSVSYET